jgi:hypothetical protein
VAVSAVAPLPLKIAQPFMAGIRAPQFSKFPPGTKGACGLPPSFLPSLAGLLHLIDAIPSHEWLGYCHAVPSAVRRGIFVEPQTKTIFSPVGAASSVRIPDDAAPDGALPVDEWRCYKYVSPDGLGKICVPSLFHLWLKNSNALCPVRPTQTAFGRVFVAGQYF